MFFLQIGDAGKDDDGWGVGAAPGRGSWLGPACTLEALLTVIFLPKHQSKHWNPFVTHGCGGIRPYVLSQIGPYSPLASSGESSGGGNCSE